MVRQGFSCCLCKKWVEERFAYMREHNYERFGNQPCPECGRIKQKIVTLIDCYDDDHKTTYRKYISCTKCVPAMGDVDYIRSTGKVCRECFSKLKNGQKWTPQNVTGSLRPCESHCRRCGKLTHSWKNNDVDLCRGACEGKGQRLTHKKNKHVSCNNLGKNDNDYSAVQKQLTEVLEELKKLKSNLNDKDIRKLRLEYQISQNKKLIKDIECVPLVKVQEQVNKSQALMKEIQNTSANFPAKSSGVRKGSNSHLIPGCLVLIVSGLIIFMGGLLVGKRSKKVKD